MAHRRGAPHPRQLAREEPRPAHPRLGDRHSRRRPCRASTSPQRPSMLKDWPGKTRLRSNSERALYREKPGPKEGHKRLRRQHAADARRRPPACPRTCRAWQVRNARAVLSPFWRTEKLEPPKNSASSRNSASSFQPATTAPAWNACSMPSASTRPSGLRSSPAPKSSPRRGRPSSAARRRRRRCSRRCRPRSVRPATLSPKRDTCAGKKKFAEAAEVMLKAPTDRASRSSIPTRGGSNAASCRANWSTMAT